MKRTKLESLDTVRERERERELTFSKINNNIIDIEIKDSNKNLRN